MFSSPQKEALYPLVVTPHLPLPWSLWRPLIFLPLWACLSGHFILSVSMDLPFWTFHTNGSIQYMIFFVWLLLLSIIFLRFIHVITCVNISFLFLAEHYSMVWICHILHIHSSVHDIWVVSTLYITLEHCKSAFLIKQSMNLSYDLAISLLDTYLREVKNKCPQKRIFITALFIITTY